MKLSTDTDAWLRAISAKFARRIVKEAAMDVRYIPTIPMLDEPVHTDERPWCRDASCPCHDVVTGDEYQNEAYHRLIVRPLMAGLITATEANRIFFDEQL